MKVRGRLAAQTQTWEEDGLVMVRCGLCGQPLRLGEATIDHIIPKSKGGPDRLDNLQLAHEACNIEKGDRVSPIRVAFEKARQE
ncbi:MAG: HNH endonuclease [Chloroflexi bacterium]|nr:HNH endonuclease [Chloroflexota bacterium]